MNNQDNKYYEKLKEVDEAILSYINNSNVNIPLVFYKIE